MVHVLKTWEQFTPPPVRRPPQMVVVELVIGVEGKRSYSIIWMYIRNERVVVQRNGSRFVINVENSGYWDIFECFHLTATDRGHIDLDGAGCLAGKLPHDLSHLRRETSECKEILQ